MRLLWVVAGITFFFALSLQRATVRADDDDDDDTATGDSGAAKLKSKLGTDTSTQTDSGAVEREEQAIKVDGLSVSEYKALREAGEKHQFQAEVDRMMKLIINSLYTNKEIFLRELISNASDALDKIRFLSLKDKSVLGDTPDLTIKIHADKENKVLHITDTGVGMTKEDLVKNLGTIAKSGTAEFLAAVQAGTQDTSALIGQFGVGFYSAFLVADTVVVTTKNNNDKQYIWESNASTFTIIEDTRPGEQLNRGTRVSLYLKEEAQDFLEQETIRSLVTKYSEFIQFDIFLYTSKTVEVEEEEEEEEAATEDKEEKKEDDDEAKVEEEADDTGAKETEATGEKKKTTKTVWEWEVINANKPIWTRNIKDIEDEEYNKFYKAFSKESKDPLGRIHFTAEGEVTFRSILFVPAEAPTGFFNDYGAKKQNIKMYVRRVFITDSFDDLLPRYLGFIKGVVDSDDLPLNISRETLQQHKLLKVIKKKLVRKALEMLKKMPAEDYKKFWKEFGTAIKLGIIEDYANRTRLSKLLRFASSNSKDEPTSLEDYVSRMKDKQENIFFLAGSSRAEVEKSPFVERVLKRGYEVLFLTEPVDEYTVQSLPEFDGKKFQSVAKEGLKFGDETDAEKEAQKALETEFEPLTKWFGEEMKDSIDKAVVSNRLTETPCALVANTYGWTGNMERIMKSQAYAKADDSNTNYYATQKKILEINPRHPLIKALLRRVKDAESKEGDEKETFATTTKDLAEVLLDTARLRSAYAIADQTKFAGRIERMLRLSAGVALDEKVEEEPVFEQPAATKSEDEDEDEEEEAADADEAKAPKEGKAKESKSKSDDDDEEEEDGGKGAAKTAKDEL